MIETKLQKPWIPISVTHSENEISIKLWGREYIFYNSIFPAKIITAEQNILAEPISLRTFFAGKEGKPQDTKYTGIEQCDGACEFTVSQRIENTIINARVRVEYDGLIRVRFCIIPFWNEEWNRYGKEDSEYRLDGMHIEIPLKKEFSNLYHYYPNDNGSTITLFSNTIPSGILPQTGLCVPFKPYVWLGWEEGGLSLSCENDKNLELNDSNKALEYIVDDDKVLLKVHLLDHKPTDWQNRKEMWADAALPIEFDYSLQATPVKPRPNSRLTDFQIFHRDATAQKIDYIFEEFEKSEETGRDFIRTLAEHGAKYFLILGWTEIQNYWKAPNEAQFKKFVDICHEYGVEPIMYFGYEYATVMPDWFDRGQEYLQKNTEGRLSDGWLMKPPMPWHRAYTMCLNSSYSEVFLKGIVDCMDRYGIKGIYLDGTFNFGECANAEHGCGYVDREGKRHHTYPIFAVREFAKKLYEKVHARNGILYVHQSGTCSVPTMSFSDVVLTGESVMGKHWNKEISLDCFRAEHSGLSTGINTQWIASKPEGREEVNLEYIVAMPLLHGVMAMPRYTIEDLDFASKIWNAHRIFGIEDAEFVGYWQKNCPVTIESEKAFASVYCKPDKLLAVVSNIGDEIANVSVTVKNEVKQVKELIADSNCVIDGHNIDIVMEPNTVRMLYIDII